MTGKTFRQQRRASTERDFCKHHEVYRIVPEQAHRPAPKKSIFTIFSFKHIVPFKVGHVDAAAIITTIVPSILYSAGKQTHAGQTKTRDTPTRSASIKARNEHLKKIYIYRIIKSVDNKQTRTRLEGN